MTNKDNQATAAAHDTQAVWEDYWRDQKKASGRLYDAIAVFYRVYIIKRSLNFFINKYFPAGAGVLHAGSGGGQVDTDAHGQVSITALDISLNALKFYRAVNGSLWNVVEGDIFSLPVREAVMDGIYNLGVMEHFTEDEIQKVPQGVLPHLKT